jgi:spore coat protein CotF
MPRFDKLDDQAMLLDAMVSDKHEAGDYNIRSSECSNKQLLDLFQNIWREEQQHVHMFMDAMTQRGWTTPLKAHSTDISQVQSEARNKAAQAPGRTQTAFGFTEERGTGYHPHPQR